MSIPLEIQFKFGEELPQGVNLNDVINAELADRCGKLLNGSYIVEDDLCILEPLGAPDKFAGGLVARRDDSICVGVDFGPIQVSYCTSVGGN